MEIGILGGGLTGIALQRFLRHPSEILEADAKPGGLCRTFWKDGFGYDIGGHILFSKNQHVNEFVDERLGENINRCRRGNWVLFKDRYVKYPFENDLAALDKQDCYECLIGFLTGKYPKPENFEQWMYYTFGAGLTEKYLLPYNQKIWKTEASQMGVEWVERIPKPPIEDVVKSALGISTEGYTHQLNFRYPLRGGIESFIDAMKAPGAKITCDARVQSIRRKGQGWDVACGDETRHFDRIVVTFPIADAVRCFADAPEDVRRAVANLHHNVIRVAMIAVNNESLLDRSAIYIPDPNVLPHRVCYMGFFSPNMVRPGTSSLIAEVTSIPGSDVDLTSEDVILERIVDDLDRVRIIRKQDIISSEMRRFEYAYPIYDLDYTRNVAIVRDYFAALDVDLLGRFAQFEYINMDECILRAESLAGKLNESN